MLKKLLGICPEVLPAPPPESISHPPIARQTPGAVPEHTAAQVASVPTAPPVPILQRSVTPPPPLLDFHTPDWQFTADNNYRLCKDYNHLLVSQMIARANIQQDSCRTPCMDWHLDIHRLYELLSKRNLPIDQFLQLPSTPRIGNLATYRRYCTDNIDVAISKSIRG